MDFEISAGQVKAMLKQGEKFTLLDVREPWELEKARLEGSKNMPMGDVPSARQPGTRSGRTHCRGVPPRSALLECHQLAAAAGIRESAVHARRDRRLGANGGSENATVLTAATGC